MVAEQLTETIDGKRIKGVTSAHTPHKLVWYYGDRTKYDDLLKGRRIGGSASFGGLVEVDAGKAFILLGEGGNVRFHDKGEPRPPKHQLLIDFDDGSALSVAVQMYGGMGAFVKGELDNKYYLAAKAKPSPFSSKFDAKYFDSIVSALDAQKLSLKGLLATEQRIPGLGNGVLQDILFNAKMHPKKKVLTLNAKERGALFGSVKNTLGDMASRGGRDTETDIFGRPGGYRAILSKNTVGKPCPTCGTALKKEAYMGGSIYYCASCQPI